MIDEEAHAFSVSGYRHYAIRAYSLSYSKILLALYLDRSSNRHLYFFLRRCSEDYLGKFVLVEKDLCLVLIAAVYIITSN